jgi:uncharacterized membrane protein YphA (DoxX/SURF4 family)
MYLGLGLFVRGVLFLYDPSAFTSLLPPTMGFGTALLYIVAFVHIVGGLLMAVGLWTRIAALAQMPILAGAVFVSLGGLFSADQSFEFSSLVLFLLVLVFVHGSGRWSVDHYWHRRTSAFRKRLDGVYSHQEKVFDLLRMYLGIGLFVRGVLFLSDSSAFIAMMDPTASPWLTSVVLIHYVALAHLFGGAMMAVGLITRVAALVQIPILVGAVSLVHFQGGLLAPSQSLEFSVLVLVLLVIVFLYGSGKWSADYYLFVRKSEEESEGKTDRARAILERDGHPPERYEPDFYEPLLDEDIATGVMTRPARSDIDVMFDDPLIAAEARYSMMGWFLFIIDVVPTPKEIIFRHIKTGEIIGTSKDPEVLERYRYH